MFGKFLEKFDIYGYPISLQYRGEETYRTAFGGVLTIFTFILICINTVDIITQYFDHSAQQEQTNTIQEDLFDMEPIQMDESMMELVVSHSGSIPPPEIGSWTASLLETTLISDIKTKPLNFGRCKER